MFKVIKQTLLLGVCCWYMCSLSWAEVYKWVDENGKIQFSDKPPAEKSAENIEDKLHRTNVDEASGKIVTSSVTGSEKTEDEKMLEAQKRQKLENAIGKECRRMKSDMESIARGDRGTFTDENGKEELVLEKDRGAKLEEWKDAYRKHGCAKLYPLE